MLIHPAIQREVNSASGKRKGSVVPVLLLLLLAGPTVAQKKAVLINASLSQPEKPIAYTGVDNVIMLRGDLKGSYIRLERSGGDIEMRAGMAVKTVLRYDQEGLDTLRVYSDGQLVIEKVYTIKKPGPYAAAPADCSDPLLTREALLKAGKLELTMPGTWYKARGKVLSYTVSVQDAEGRSQGKYKMESAPFSEALKTVLGRLSSGSQLHISSIKGLSSEGTVLSLPDLKISIK
ncbi:MAG: hypothetical protein JNL88_00200 [Bacteroidia bacterium]|nr:hypothetical protein [Bacteroidia bacterium]